LAAAAERGGMSGRGRNVMSGFDQNPDRRVAKQVPLFPESFLTEAVRISPNRLAVSHGERRFNGRGGWPRR